MEHGFQQRQRRQNDEGDGADDRGAVRDLQQSFVDPSHRRRLFRIDRSQIPQNISMRPTHRCPNRISHNGHTIFQTSGIRLRRP